jgi:2'-5' RNA ligase
VNKNFINTATTIAWDDIDFSDWHGGVKYYGFWALIIDDSEWLNAVNEAASYVSPYVLKGYQRQPHVSVITGGLMSDQHYSAANLNKHKQALIKANISPFSISLAGLDSFTSAPYLTVEDDSGSLECLRAALLASASDDSLDNYQAHITLGLYHSEFSTIALSKTINAFEAPKVMPLIVPAVKFCSYQTNDIQGRITVLDSIKLKTK